MPARARDRPVAVRPRPVILLNLVLTVRVPGPEHLDRRPRRRPDRRRDRGARDRAARRERRRGDLLPGARVRRRRLRRPSSARSPSARERPRLLERRLRAPARARSGTRSGCRMCAEQLEAVDQPRAGAGEAGGGVDGDDAAGAERGELVGVGLAPPRARARRRSRTASRPRPRAAPRATSSHDALLGVLAGQAEQVDAARVLDQLRRPVAGRRRPGRATRARRRAPARRRARRAARGRSARRRPARGRRRRPWRRSPARACARRRAPRRACAGRARRTCGLRVQPLGDRAHVVVGDRADRAQRLRDDQVGLRARAARPRRARRSRGPARSARAPRGRSRPAAGPGPITSRVTLGSSSASGGWSHSCVTAVTSSPRPRANSISVAEGTRETIRMPDEYGGRRASR